MNFGLDLSTFIILIQDLCYTIVWGLFKHMSRTAAKEVMLVLILHVSYGFSLYEYQLKGGRYFLFQ